MKKDKFSKFTLPLFWIFSFILIVCLLYFTSEAAGAGGESYFPMGQDDNNIFASQYIADIESYFDSENNLIFARYGYWEGPFINFYVAYLPKDQDTSLYGEVSNNGYQFSLYKIGSANVSYRIINYLSDGTRGGVFEASGYDFQNLNSSLYDPNVSYVSNFRVYNNNNNDKVTILTYGEDPDPEIVLGEAIPPHEMESPFYGHSHSKPEQVPNYYTINNYTWTTPNPPAIDDSGIIESINSLTYVVNYLFGWFKENLHGEFTTIMANIEGLIKYLGDTLTYYGDLIISNIQNLIMTLYNNFKSLVENLSKKVDYATEEPDSDVIWDNISGTSLVTNVTIIQNSLTSFQTSFTGVDEPTTFVIPIHLENLPTAWFGTQTTQYIDLGVINGTVKEGLRLFVWAMVTYSLVVTIFDSIANYINGGGDES